MTFQEDIKKNMDRKSSLFKPVDMTQGTPWKQILAFMIPMLIGNVAQQLYNTVDSIVVGNYLGDNALAAGSPAHPCRAPGLVYFVSPRSAHWCSRIRFL